MVGNLHLHLLMTIYSEKEELDLQLRAVPDIQRRVVELTAN